MARDETDVSYKYKILMVDDDPVTLRLLRSVMAKAGFEHIISEALDGEMALEMIKIDQPDIILLDIKLPGISGLDVCKRLKQDEGTRDIPVIFVSSVTDNAEKMRGFELGAVDYITKPFYSLEVLARVNTHISILKLRREEKIKSMALEDEIAERNKARDIIARSKKNWEDTFNAISEIITIHDMDFNVLYANKAAADAFGCGIDDIVGQKCYKIYHDKGSPAEGCPCLMVAKTGKECSAEFFESNMNRNIDLKAFPRLDENGKLIGIVHVARDITERKQEEEKTKRNLHNLEIFFKASIGRESRILELKKKIEELEGKLKKGK